MARKKAAASATTATADAIPAGFKQLNTGFADSWKPENAGEFVHGTVVKAPETVEMKQGRKVTQRRVVEVQRNGTEERVGIWDSAALTELFDMLEEAGEDSVGTELYIRFDGLGTAKKGQNPPKRFTVAVAE